MDSLGGKGGEIYAYKTEYTKRRGELYAFALRCVAFALSLLVCVVVEFWFWFLIVA
jgi:hypothetical protein